MEESKVWAKNHYNDTFELTELDRKILNDLQNDGTLSLRQLAKNTGSSVNTVKKRIQAMTDEDVILRTSAIINCCKIGYHEMLILSLRINSTNSISKIFENLHEIEGINAIYQVSGQYPVMCMAKCVSKENQIELIEKVKNIIGVEELVTQVVMRRVKEDFRLSIP